MAGGDFDDAFGSSVNARMASHAGEGPTEPVDDLPRAAVRGEPPVPGAQWDEVHLRWEHWDEETETWVIVGDDVGDGIPTSEESSLPAVLARDLLHADEMEADHEVVRDVDRASPSGPAPPGAQWNEVAVRWERWDEASASWVEAVDDPAAPEAP
ncbi:MAG: hypothetical protein ABWZ52_06675 [Acidimicrobiales bacterium]